jgi:hypothetical protein
MNMILPYKVSDFIPAYKYHFRFEYIKSVQIITVGCHSVLPRSRNASHLSAHYRLPQGDY